MTRARKHKNTNLIIVKWKVLLLLLLPATCLTSATIQTYNGTKVASSSSSTTANDASPQPSNISGEGGGEGAFNAVPSRIVQSLFRFPATKLGPEFNDVLQNWYTDWFHLIPESNSTSAKSAHRLPPITPEPNGVDHAFYSVSTPAATLFRRQCYGPAPANNNKSSSSSRLPNLYDNFEQRRKKISFEFLRDPDQERMNLHILTRRFYSAFLNAEDNSVSNNNIEDDEDVNANGENKSSNNNNNLGNIHRKKSKSTINTVYAQTTIPSDYDSPSKLSFQTFSKNEDASNNNNNNDNNDGGSENRTAKTPKNQQWTWQTPGLFSERGSTNFIQFRQKMYFSMRATQLVNRLRQALPSFTGWEHGRQSGMFWYPPGGVREWHTNRYDLGHEMMGLKPSDREVMKSQVWRMYFVRTIRDDEFDNKLEKLKKRSSDGSNNDHSGMHIIPGEDAGLTVEVLRRAGARPLTKEEKRRQWSDEFAEDYVIPSSLDETDASSHDDDDENNNFDRNSVWRVPDHDGYVTLFRLPNIWHCIISEEVHRYSLGFAFSEKEAQALLKMAGVDFDVVEAPPDTDDDSRMDKNDEL